MIYAFNDNGLEKIIIENNYLRLVFLPAIGGKMIELKNLKTGTQFLLENQHPEKIYRNAFNGADFSDYDVSGFDECFPTISECRFKFKDAEFYFPDHGELWSSGWSYELGDGSVALSKKGINFDYTFNKRISLDKNSVKINYSVKNDSEADLPYIWSAHPLLFIKENYEIILPAEVQRVFLNWASDNSIGKSGDILTLPSLSKEMKVLNFGVVPEFSAGSAVKIFTEKLQKGYAGLYHTDTNESILFKFDTKEIPDLGLWLCYGGWPSGKNKKHYTIALEPSIGSRDSLKEAVNNNECKILKNGEAHNWSLYISLQKGKELS